MARPFQGGTMANVEAISSATTLSKADSNKVIVVDASTGFTLTLPACQKGLEYKILFKVGGTDAAMKIAVTAGDAFFGRVQVQDNNTDNQTAMQVVTYATATGTPGSYDVMTFDGDATTSGCSAGDIVEIVAIDDAAWAVNALLTTTGTPSSVAVIAGS
tara:strand:+ start:1582 stop:2058 length:477 start_codon:yes stop_codon:yes gene_type:complete